MLHAAFGCYQLHLPAGSAVDVEEADKGVVEAEAAVDSGDASSAVFHAEAARGVLRLPLLAGVDAPWVEVKRAELQGLHVRALEALAAGHLALGKGEAALAAAREAVALDPYRESAHCLIMAAHSSCGRQGAAVRAYEACRRLLAEEVGVSPSAATQSAYLELLAKENEPGQWVADRTRPPAAVARDISPSPRSAEPSVVPLPTPLASSRVTGFQGRSPELESLSDALRAAVTGERRVALVAGEEGMGKTALVAEAAAAAHAAGATVLYGHCDQDLGLAYLPWVEALTGLVAHDSPGLVERLGVHRAQLARLVPTVAESLDDLPAVPPADPEAERFVLFRAVVAALEAAAARAPVVIVLEDLHWADKPTLTLLRHVATGRDPLRLLLIGTYRHHELGGGHGLVDVLASLRREPLVQRLMLSGLSDEELVTFMESAANHPLGGPEVALAHALHGQTGGHPFFVSEMLRHLVETGAMARSPNGAWVRMGETTERLPDSVREVVARRVDRLGEEARRILSHAAVIGVEFQLPVLAAAVGADAGDVLDTVEAAEAAGLVASTSAGSFRFVHAVVARVLYQDLTATRRALAHRRVAQVLEDLDLVEEHVDELSGH